MKKYRVMKDRTIGGVLYAQTGDVVEDAQQYDYGVAADDTRVFGHKHISVRKPGHELWFTIPVSVLVEVTEKDSI